MDKQKLLALSKMSIESRLNWLEEANKFISQVKKKPKKADKF